MRFIWNQPNIFVLCSLCTIRITWLIKRSAKLADLMFVFVYINSFFYFFFACHVRDLFWFNGVSSTAQLHACLLIYFIS